MLLKSAVRPQSIGSTGRVARLDRVALHEAEVPQVDRGVIQWIVDSRNEHLLVAGGIVAELERVEHRQGRLLDVAQHLVALGALPLEGRAQK